MEIPDYLQNSNYIILQLIDTLESGGAERMAVNLANALTAQNIPNTLVATYRDGPMSASLCGKTDLHILHKKSATDIAAFLRCVKLVHTIQPTHLHAHSTSIVWAVLIKLLFPPIHLIWHDHFGLNPREYPRTYMRYLLPFINTVIAVKQELVSWVRQLSPPARVSYLPNFASLELTNDVRDPKSVLCLANFRRQKDFATLIRAAAIMRDQQTDFKLRMVGNLADQEYVKEITQLIADLNLSTHITIAGPTRESGAELTRAGIGVLSSNSEGLPVSLIEYGLAALPVAVTDTGQCREVLGNGTLGHVVPVGDAIKLAAALTDMLTNREEATALGNLLKKHVQQNYGAGSFMHQYLTLVCNPDYV